MIHPIKIISKLGMAGVCCAAWFSLGCQIDEDQSLQGTSIQGLVGITEETGYTEWTGAVGVDYGCTGTLIDPEVVLTAKHCVGSGTSFAVTGGASINDIFYGNSTQVLLGSNDIALLKIPAITTAECYGIKSGSEVTVGTEGWLVGYGTTAESGADVGFGVHRKGRSGVLSVSGHIIELGGESNHCSGDSGGPFFVEQDGEWVVAGVTSYGQDQTCPADKWGFDESVFAAYSWIDEGVKTLTGHGVEENDCGLSADADSDSDTDSDTDSDSDSDIDADADTDIDSDTDSDADSNSDADSDSDTDSDGEEDDDDDENGSDDDDNDNDNNNDDNNDENNDDEADSDGSDGGSCGCSSVGSTSIFVFLLALLD